jgi:molybdenum cofactor biosynthesis enzyme
MADPAFVYTFEGVPADLPRPPLAAMRALLSAGVLLSARAWQELPPETRVEIARVGYAETMDEHRLETLLKQVHVSNIKFIGRRSEPDPSLVPADLAAAVGPMRPLTLAEWSKLRALDRYVLVSLVKNSRLLAKALNEMLPQGGGVVNGAGVVVAWSGLVARCELRLRREAVQKAMSSEFMGGRAFVLANIAGRRAARRSSELLDLQAESTVGPVEVDWGVRQGDDVLFWQAHVSAWDGTFFPVAAMLAATTAAAAMYDMVRAFDPSASLVFAGVREEPWQAGRDQLQEPGTALFSKPVGVGTPAPAKVDHRGNTLRMDGQDTLRMEGQETLLRDSGPRLSSPSFADALRAVPLPTGSTPSLLPAPSSGGTPSSSDRGISSSSRRRAAPPRPAWIGIAIVGLVVLANLVVILGIVVFLTHGRR